MIYDSSPVPSIVRQIHKDKSNDRVSSKYRDNLKAKGESVSSSSRGDRQKSGNSHDDCDDDDDIGPSDLPRDVSVQKQSPDTGNCLDANLKKESRYSKKSTQTKKSRKKRAYDRHVVSSGSSITSLDSCEPHRRAPREEFEDLEVIESLSDSDYDSSGEMDLKPKLRKKEPESEDARFTLGTAVGDFFQYVADAAWKGADSKDNEEFDGQSGEDESGDQSQSESEGSSNDEDQSLSSPSIEELAPKEFTRDSTDMTHKSTMLKQQMELLALQSQVIDRLIEEKKEADEETSIRSEVSRSSKKTQQNSKFKLPRFRFPSKKTKKPKQSKPSDNKIKDDVSIAWSRASRASQASSVDLARELRAKIEEISLENEKRIGSKNSKIPTSIKMGHPPRQQKGRPPLPRHPASPSSNKFRKEGQEGERKVSKVPASTETKFASGKPSSSDGSQRPRRLRNHLPDSTPREANSNETSSRLKSTTRVTHVGPKRSGSRKETSANTGEISQRFGMFRGKQSPKTTRSTPSTHRKVVQAAEQRVATSSSSAVRSNAGTRSNLDASTEQERDSRESPERILPKHGKGERRDGIEDAIRSGNVDPPGDMRRAASRRDNNKPQLARLPVELEMPSRNLSKPIDKRYSRATRSFQPKKAPMCRLEDYALNRPSPNLERNLAVIENPEIELCLSNATSTNTSNKRSYPGWRS